MSSRLAIFKVYLEMLPTHWLSFVVQLVIICYEFVDQLAVQHVVIGYKGGGGGRNGAPFSNVQLGGYLAS